MPDASETAHRIQPSEDIALTRALHEKIPVHTRLRARWFALALLASAACAKPQVVTRTAPRTIPKMNVPVSALPTSISTTASDEPEPCLVPAGLGSVPPASPSLEGSGSAQLAPLEPPASVADFTKRERQRDGRDCAEQMAGRAAKSLPICFQSNATPGRYDVSFVVSGDGRAAAVRVMGPPPVIARPPLTTLVGTTTNEVAIPQAPRLQPAVPRSPIAMPVDGQLVRCIRAYLGPMRFARFSGTTISVSVPITITPPDPPPEPPAAAMAVLPSQSTPRQKASVERPAATP